VPDGGELMLAVLLLGVRQSFQVLADRGDEVLEVAA
jgi:hypothetical protein